VIGEERRGGLQQARFCVKIHTVVCIKSRGPDQPDLKLALSEHQAGADLPNSWLFKLHHLIAIDAVNKRLYEI
jgi:hypothetical protein